MQDGMKPGCEERTKLLLKLSERKIPLSQQEMITEEMVGKSEQEREAIANRLLKEIELGKLQPVVE